MSSALKVALKSFVQGYLDLHREQNANMRIQFDRDWPSPCYQSEGEEGEWVEWLPVEQQEQLDFTDLERALELTLHPDLKTFFTCYWSDNLNATAPRGDLQLLLPWNEHDFARLQENLVGHVLMKRRLGQPITLFFAVTDEDDFILSLDNESGQVVLEQVGLEPKEVLAPNLAEFITSLSPKVL